MTTLNFTFGFEQLYPNGFVSITGPTEDSCRTAMLTLYGNDWCGQYSGKHQFSHGEVCVAEVELNNDGTLHSMHETGRAVDCRNPEMPNSWVKQREH